MMEDKTAGKVPTGKTDAEDEEAGIESKEAENGEMGAFKTKAAAVAAAGEIAETAVTGDYALEESETKVTPVGAGTENTVLTAAAEESAVTAALAVAAVVPAVAPGAKVTAVTTAAAENVTTAEVSAYAPGVLVPALAAEAKATPVAPASVIKNPKRKRKRQRRQ